MKEGKSLRAGRKISKSGGAERLVRLPRTSL